MKNTNQNSAAGSLERRRYWVELLSIIAVVFVTLCSAFAIATLRKQAVEYNRVEILLLSLDRSVHELSSIEWQAIASKKLNSEISENLEKTHTALDTVIGEFALYSLYSQPLKQVSTCYSVYKQAVDEEFKLIAAGRIDEAESLDDKQVDPAFDALKESISAANAVYDNMVRWKIQAANVGSTLVVLFASGIIGLLFWRFSRAQLASQLAKAEQSLLREANEALQAEVTERKRIEEALVQLSRQNEIVLNTAGEGILGLDLEGNHTFVNPAAAKIFGYEAGELIGRHSHSMWHHTKPDGSPYPPEECPIYATLKDGAVHQKVDDVFWRKDGTSFPVEFVSTPIRSQGKVTGAVVTFNDITKRKQEEAEREKLITELKDALARIKQLSERLSICSYCKKIKDDNGYWQQLETYISEHTDTLFSHGICPECAKKAYKELDEFKAKKNRDADSKS